MARGDEKGEFTFVNRNGCSIVDMCFTNERFLTRVGELLVHESVFSHHSAIKLQIGCANKTATMWAKKTIRWESTRAPLFLQNLYDTCDTFRGYGYEQLIARIYKAAKKTGLKPIHRPCERKSEPAWMDELKQSKRIYRYCERVFRNCTRGYIHVKMSNINKMIEAKKSYADLLKQKKEQFFNKIQAQIVQSKDSKQFWSALNVYRTGRKNTSPVNPEIEITSWRNHFQNISMEKEPGK